MNELLLFIRKNSKWFVFAICAIVSCVMLFQSNPYHQHLYLTSAGRAVSSVYKSGSMLSSYLNLRSINEDLNRRNAELQAEIAAQNEVIERLHELGFRDTLVTEAGVRHFDFIVAHVINNSIARPFNYITINKGSADGVRPELGVIDQNGVVGIVSNVGSGSARVISLLNPNFRLSCKIKRSDYFGSLVWDGKDPREALLEELPRHTVFEPGDTIVTSGYSAVFPEGLPVGVIMPDNNEHNENFFTLRVRLLADFTTLGNVQVVVNNFRAELDSLTVGESEDAKRKPFGN
ncbi:MAG: rod shape-determining protein MreC [Muribaculaceae bacterium]|nr:rod shape-determining protein MreC [Muribaculaceae bacterium]